MHTALADEMADQWPGFTVLVPGAEAAAVEVHHDRHAGGPVTPAVEVELVARPLAVGEVADPCDVPRHPGSGAIKIRARASTAAPDCRVRIGAKSPADDHREPDEYDRRGDSDDDASRRIKIALRQCEGDRSGQQVAGKRQLIDHQRRHSRDSAEPSPGGEGAGSGPAHQDDRDQQTNRHELTLP